MEKGAINCRVLRSLLDLWNVDEDRKKESLCAALLYHSRNVIVTQSIKKQ